MGLPFVLFYLSAGIVTALVTMLVFPPEAGYRPGVSLQLCALTTFILLWPLLVALAVWYHVTQFSNRLSHRDHVSRPREYSVPRSVHVVKPK